MSQIERSNDNLDLLSTQPPKLPKKLFIHISKFWESYMRR